MGPHAVSVVCAAALLLATSGLAAIFGRGDRAARPDAVPSRRAHILLSSAVSGDLLSVAAVMGVAGMVMRFGYDALWYPVGYAAGGVVLLLLLVGPLRRDGALSAPDFAARRLDSRAVGVVATAFAALIGVFHMLAQLKGAGLLFAELLDWPYWAGVLVVGFVIAAQVMSAPRRDVTLARAARHWLAQSAIAIPLFVLVALPRSGLDGTVSGAAASIATAPAASSAQWTLPFGALTSGHGDGLSLLYTLSLLVALLCGAAGLPQLYLRSHSTANARDARRTALHVAALLSLLLALPAAWGFLGRAFNPSLYADGATDLVIVRLPQQVLSLAGHPLAGAILSGVTAAGVFAACTTGFAVLLSSVSRLLADAARHTHRPGLPSARDPSADPERAGTPPCDTPPPGTAVLRISSALLAATAVALALLVRRFDIGMLVGWAFALAASTLFPLLVLGVWYRDLTATGAVAGMAAGGVGALGSIAFAMLIDAGAATAATPLVGVLTSQPAIWCVPLAFASMVFVSMAAKGTAPADARLRLLRLHAPEQLGL